MNGYDFKQLPELGWAALIAVIVAVGQVLLETDIDTVTDWETLIAMLSAASARSVGVGIKAGIGALLALLRPS